MRRIFVGMISLVLLLSGSILAGSLPRYSRKLEPGGMSPAVRYEIPYLNDRIAEEYQSLALGVEGKFYSAVDFPLIKAICRVLEENLLPGADIVFVIDHTSSMRDDIDEVARELKSITERLESAGMVRMGVVSFSDVRSGTEYGYQSLDLNLDYSGVGKFLDRIDLVGSVEDIYGAIWKTVDEFTWESQSKRMIVVISDEAPAVGRETDFTEADVFLKCKSENVVLFPILIDKNEN